MISKRMQIIIASLVISAFSCQSNAVDSSACSSLVSDIPFERLNKDLILSTPYDQKDYTIQEDLRFFADNYSEDVLESTPDKDLEAYLWNGSEWIQIKNKLDYLSKVDRFGPKGPNDPGGHNYYIFYDTSLVQGPTRFCIILRAIKDPENAHLEIASYIEIEVNP